MSTNRPAVATLGLPQSDSRFELKTAHDAHRAGCITDSELAEIGRGQRRADWRRLAGLGVTRIPSNDPGTGDRRWSTAAMVGVAATAPSGADRPGPAPRLGPDQEFFLASTRPIAEFLEARLVGIHTRPVLLGPVSFLALARPTLAGFDVLALLPRALPVWAELLRHLRRAGADRVQIDEPCLTGASGGPTLEAAKRAYAALASDRNRPEIMLVPGGGDLSPVLAELLALPVGGLHLDLVSAPDLLDRAVARAGDRLVLSLGVIDGRIGRPADLSRLFDRLSAVAARRGTERIELAPSCALRRLPYDVAPGRRAIAAPAGGHALATRKIGELGRLATALAEGRRAIAEDLAAGPCLGRVAAEPDLTMPGSLPAFVPMAAAE